MTILLQVQIFTLQQLLEIQISTTQRLLEVRPSSVKKIVILSKRLMGLSRDTVLAARSRRTSALPNWPTAARSFPTTEACTERGVAYPSMR
jgi:hypothetical protein